MPKLIKLFSLLFAIAIPGHAALAQGPTTAAPLKHYKVDFVLKEADATGRVINSRTYSTIVATKNTNQPNQIRSGNRIPFKSGTDDKGNTEIQYVDIGVNIDCHNIQEIDQNLAMSVKAEVSSIPGGPGSTSELGPVIHQFQWNSDVVVAPGVPTTIFSSDDTASKTRTQVEVIATPIK